MKVETANPPRNTIRAQQSSFDRFQIIYNEERPHEALDMRVPAELYDLSPRAMPETIPEHQYADGFEVRRVRPDGQMKWDGGFVFVGMALRGESVGVEAIDDGVWHLHLGPVRLGAFHERSKTVVPILDDPRN